MRTHRLELEDQNLREWDATVLAASPEGIVLDRSAFYPGGGGQPPDHGVLIWQGVETRIVGARKGDELELIPAEGDPIPVPGTTVRCAIADERRTALMRSSNSDATRSESRSTPSVSWVRSFEPIEKPSNTSANSSAIRMFDGISAIT